MKIPCVPLTTEPGWLADRCSVSQQLGALQTHSFSFLTQRTYSCSNFFAVSSLMLELLKKMPRSVASGTHCIKISVMSGDGNSAERALDFLTKITKNLTVFYAHFCLVGKTCYVLVDKCGRKANLTTELCLMSNWIFTSHRYINLYFVVSRQTP